MGTAKDLPLFICPYICFYIIVDAHTGLFCICQWVYSTHSLTQHTHTKTHIPRLNGTTVVVRSSPGSPLISSHLLCLLSRPALQAEPVFNMAVHPGSQSNNKLYLQLSAGLNHWDYCSTKCWITVNIPAGEKGKQTQRDKYHPLLNRNILWSSQSHFHHLQIWHRSQKGERISLSFNECVESQWNPFWWWAFSHKYTIGHSQRAFNGAVICCPVRHHSWSSPRQLMELHRPANGSQRARSSLCGQNGCRYPFSSVSLWNE